MPLFRRPVLISSWPNRVLLDTAAALTWPAATLVLQPHKESPRHGFFVALQNGDLGRSARSAVLGRSIEKNLHTVAVEAIAQLVGNGCRKATDETGQHLARWLVEVANDAKGYAIHKETPYLFTSGAQRAKAMAIALQQVTHRRLESLVDIGSAVGLIPWLLTSNFPSLQSATLVEPKVQFRDGRDLLWEHGPGVRKHAFLEVTAEKAAYGPADLIMFSHLPLADRARAAAGYHRSCLARAKSRRRFARQ